MSYSKHGPNFSSLWFSIACRPAIHFLKHFLIIYANRLKSVHNTVSMSVTWLHYTVGFILMKEAKTVTNFMQSDVKKVVFSTSVCSFFNCPVFTIKRSISTKLHRTRIESVRQYISGFSVQFIRTLYFINLFFTVY